MYFVVYRLNQIMQMTIINLIIQVALGAIIYVTCLFVLHAPVIEQAKTMLDRR